jgi:hypothetical protein
VDSVTVFSRLLRTVKPTLQGDFFSGTQADLYGPFWIMTTLVLIVWVSSSLEASFYSGSWAVSVTKVGVAAGVLYSALALVPLASYLALKYSSVAVEYVTLLSLYSYSFTLFIPALLLCIVPLSAFQIAVMLSAAVWSLGILVKNYWTEILTVHTQRKFLVLGVLSLGHIGFVLACLLYFLS